MTWDPIPWAVADDAGISVETGRVLAYNALRGNEGIQSYADCQVKALATPAAKVTMLTGAVGILNRTAGYAYQAYVGRCTAAETVNITPTGSGSGRHDLIVARVEDPTVSGAQWQPTNPAQYIFTRAIPSVPASCSTVTELNLGFSAIPLARLDIPANTSAITQAMIKDLRSVANPRRDQRLFTAAVTQGAEDVNNILGGTGEVWPDAASWDIYVPPWATRVRTMARWDGVKQPPGNQTGRVWVQIGAIADPSTYSTQFTQYDTMGLTQNARISIGCSDDVAMIAGYRGQVVRFAMRGRVDSRLSGGTAGDIRMDAASSLSLVVEFLEAPDFT